MEARETQVRLALDIAPEADAEEAERLTRQLRRELLELDVESADLVREGEAPAKAKAGDPVAWGELLLTLAASGGALTALVKALQAWVTRQNQSSLSLEIDGDKLEVTGASTEERERLIMAWLSRHTGAMGADA